MVEKNNDIRDWVIYKITSPTGRVYVGKTSNIKSRMYSYRISNCKSQSALYGSITKYGFENHIFEVIDSFDGNNSEANSKEMFWIRTNMSNCHKWPNMRGLNLTDGGEGTIGNKPSKETRAKQSASKKGQPAWNKGLKGCQAAWNKGVKCGVAWNKGKSYSHLTDEERKNLFGKHNIGNTYNKGRKHTKEYCEAIIKRQTGKDLEKKWKPILHYSPYGEFLKEYKSVKEAAADLGIHRTHITMILRGKVKNPKYHVFRYKSGISYNKFIFQRKVFNRMGIKDMVA